MKEVLFVYGTLRRGGGHELEKMFEDARFIEEGEFCGKMVLVDYFPGVIDATEPQAMVSGEIYELDGDGKSLMELDEFEDFRPLDPQGGVYRRERRRIRMKSGGWKDAWIYIYNHPIGQLRAIESGDFVRFLRESRQGLME
jgi:gamma-glutamylcyclotransferase (GGCT)/AIG2-like uncharacterized protein YtfP